MLNQFDEGVTSTYEVDTAELSERVAVDLDLENTGPADVRLDDLVHIIKTDRGES